MNSNLPPGVTDRMIEQQQDCFCRGCGKMIFPKDDEDLCPKCQRIEDREAEEE